MITEGSGAWTKFDDQEQFQRMMEALSVAVYTTDAEGRITYCNSAAATLVGRQPEIGKDQWCITWKMFLPDGTRLPHDQCPMAVALKGGIVAEGVECVAERPDGSRFWFTPHPSIMRDQDGHITGGINVLVDITKQKVTEIAHDENFRAVFNITPECVKIVSQDGTVLEMNSAGLSMLDAPCPEAVIGKSVYNVIAPQDRDRFREFKESVCAGNQASLEFEIVGLLGNRRDVETHAAPLPQSDGATALLAITRDVTERKRGERVALLLSAIVDSSDDAIVSKDLNGVITSWNKGAERVFGYTAAEAVGNPVTILIPPDRLPEEPTILSRLRRGERVDHFETIRRRKDGTLINISLTISPVRDSTGRIVGASKIARDITEKKRFEAALVASEARFRQLADSMPQIVWTARPDGYLDYFNERWYEFTGFPRDQFGDGSWEPVLHPDDVQRSRDTWHAAVNSGTSYRVEYRFKDRVEQRWRWFMGRALPVRNEQGIIVKWFGSFTDIDDQKRVEEELRRTNKDLEQFAFSASHDLQEPLRNVKIYSELLAKRYAHRLDGQALEFLDYVRGGATRMELLVRDLLAYTQVVKLDNPAELTNANEALAAALANLSSVILDTGARITSDPLPMVCAHVTQLQQIFQNLIGNAIKYRSPVRPVEVHISVVRQMGNWEFSVSDNGIGIPPEYKEKIFGLFKRLHSTDEYSGTGIGLAICQRVVDRHNGRIWVESKPGEGSTFRFSLPL